ncbi:hypothetical protein HR13_02890 [Porphyromonas gulae]|uniref:ATP-binding domain-containing protein n=1 Tax=Porphyromonas gulae TaxID=111105 RepID=UPI0003621F5D|nr:ATP-binding domain-containing protein [Porphyromonas gulae]KGN80755.1 hypothetical protein HR13_02890 [Porphyromonas gulae]
MSNYFYLQLQLDVNKPEFVAQVEEYATTNKALIYVLDRPLAEQKKYDNYPKGMALIVLRPKHRIAILKIPEAESEQFNEHVEDIIEDIGYISDRYDYKGALGRPRVWKDRLISVHEAPITDVIQFWDDLSLKDPSDIKDVDLLISLLIGSINDIERVKSNVPETTLDKVKQKIQLFDADQTRFIYETPKKKTIRIQGLSGTGKTELLLHKLKELYTEDENAKICFTCHNKILATEISTRIPQFFNFMKVEQQIEWRKRLWCVNAWGSARDENSGAYRYICEFYGLPFYSLRSMSFESACKLAKEQITQKEEQLYAFTYMFVDESQDFPSQFIELCETVTEKTVYVAGDIFQSIFDENISRDITPDFLLGKCYRTDPKTLMFAHALGMGLFEQHKLRWLEKKEWEDCGYEVSVVNGEYHLTREPIRRFEDLDNSFESVRMKQVDTAPSLAIVDIISLAIVDIIKEIKEEHPTVLPEDIGIIFLDTEQYIYELASSIEAEVYESFQWEVNKAYESKQREPHKLLISNRNNVKGLEFPFVICVTREIRNSIIYRNALYTMLTRSFIQSYLITQTALCSEMKEGWDQIHLDKEMVIKEPSSAEKEQIQTRFRDSIRLLSLDDRLKTIFDRCEIPDSAQENLRQMLRQLPRVEGWEDDKLEEWVDANKKYV